MKHSSVLLALLAGVAIGCAPSTNPTDGGTAAKPADDEKVASGTEPIPTTPSDTGPGMVGTVPTGPAPTGVETKEPKQLTPPTAATGQQGGGQDGGQRGGGGGRRGGFNIAMLLANEQARELIKAELKLTDDQITKLTALRPEPPAQGAPQPTPEERQKQREEMQKKINDILTPAQEQRVKQIQLQMQGTRALTSEEVVKELGLSEKQVAEIEAAREAGRPQMGGGQQQGGTSPTPEERQKMIEQFQKAREEANKKVLAILTPAQRAKWEKMLGKKFEMPMTQMGGGQRGGGGMGGAGIS
jgi:hypothetical protein